MFSDFCIYLIGNWIIVDFIWIGISFFFFFLISNKSILKRKRVSPEYTGSIHQGQKQIKCIKYKSP